ncbi:MAG: hypothetical protein ACPK85_12600 [Methanosarcina sp.]
MAGNSEFEGFVVIRDSVIVGEKAGAAAADTEDKKKKEKNKAIVIETKNTE